MTQITSMESGTRIGRNIDVGRNSRDGIPARNIGRFVLFEKGTSNFSDRITSWHGAAKSECENRGDNSIFENAKQKIILKLKKFGTNIL